MRGAVPVLPDGAAARLNELELQRDAALDAAGACAARLSNLRDPEQQPMRDRLTVERDKHQARYRALAGLSSKVNQWLMELPAGSELMPACPIVFRPKNGETPLAAVERLRAEIKAVRERLATTMRAPLPLDAQRSLIVQAVAERARAGRPTVSIANDAASVSWGEGTSPTALLAWIDPQRMIDALSAELHEDDSAMSAQERDSAVSRLQDQLADLEAKEAALLEYADANGIGILPRIDMDPRAFLSCVIAQATAQVA